MALLFVDSFDHYATADLLEKWSDTALANSGSVAIDAASGRRSSAGFKSMYSGAGTVQSQVVKNLTSSGNTVIIGVAVRTDQIPTGAATTIVAVDDGGTTQLSWTIRSDAKLEVRRGGQTGTILGTTSTAILAVNTFVYLELKAVIDPTVGTIDVRVNGTSLLSATGLNTRNSATSTWTAVRLGLDARSADSGIGSGSTREFEFDDLYVCDGSGPAPWNTFLGDVRVDVRYPTAEGASSQWTPSSGTDNALLLDETAPNDDTDYTSTATVSQKDTYVVQDAPVVGAVILGVQVNMAAKKTDSGLCSLAPVVRHSGTDYQGTDKNLGTSYSYLSQVYQANPGTSAQWTEAGFNAAEFGYIRTA